MKIKHYRQSLLHLLQHLRPKWGLYCLILLAGAVVLSNFVQVKNISTESRIEQETALKLQDPNYIAAQKAFKNGLLLSKLDLVSKREAIKEYETAIQLWQKLGDQASQSNVLNKLGQTYLDLGEKEKSIDYYKQALKLSR